MLSKGIKRVGLPRCAQLWVVVLGLPIAAFAQVNTPVVSDNGELGEIVVTAQRRESSIEQVPVAVSALSGDQIHDKLIYDINDLTTVVPDLEFSQAYSTALVTIRGVGTSLTLLGADPAMAINLDDVYIGRPVFALSNFLDVQRIEVLRGPQGTLFGRNTTGGVINIVPNTPTQDFESDVRATIGADPFLYDFESFVSGSLNSSGTLAGRVSVQRDYNLGYASNGTSGGPRRLDDLGDTSGRVQVEWDPTSTFKTRAEIDLFNESDNGACFYSAGRPDGTVPITETPAYGGIPGNAPAFRCEANEGEVVRQFITSTLHTDWNLGPGSLLGTFSENHVYNHVLHDSDGTSDEFVHENFAERSHQYYNQLIYQSDKSLPLQYLVGAVLYNETASQTATVPTGFLAPPFEPVDLNPVILRGTLRTESAATFFHADYDLLSSLHLFAGGRYTYDTKALDEFNFALGSKSQADSWRKFTYQGGIKYDLSSNTNVYASYSTGYKSGGYNLGSLAPPFNPETTDSTEVGFKGSMLDHRLIANLAAFYVHFDDMQVTQVGTISELVTNAAKSTIKGVEAELTGRPVDDVRIEFSGSYLDAKFDDFTSVDASRPYLGPLNLAGNFLPNAPRFKASIASYYTVPFKPGDLEIGARYYWQARTYFSEFNLPIDSQEAVGRIDLTGTFLSTDKRWKFVVFGRNITNKAVANYGSTVADIATGVTLLNYDPGRTTGITVERVFR